MASDRASKTWGELYRLARRDTPAGKSLVRELIQDVVSLANLADMRDTVQHELDSTARRKWGIGSHTLLVISYYYELQMGLPRDEVLARLGELSFVRLKTTGAVENRLAKALREVNVDDLPDAVREFARTHQLTNRVSER